VQNQGLRKNGKEKRQVFLKSVISQTEHASFSGSAEMDFWCFL